MLHHPFQDSFWSPNAALDAVPNFSYGLDVLHGKLHQSMEENTVIVQYLRQRIAAEHGYAELLQALSFDNIETAFEKDVGAGLKRSFEIVRSESGETANGHLTRANNLTETALDPLERLAMRYQRIVQNTKTTMDKRIKDFEIMAESVDQVRTTYKVKCRAVQALDLEYLPPLPYVDMQVRLGKFTFAYMEIIRLLQRMSQDYNQQPKQETTLQEDHDIVVLTGEFIYEWMHNYCHLLLQNENNNHDTDFPSSFTLKNERERNTQMTMEICQDLLAYSFLCSVSGGQSTFDSLPDVFYKIRKQTFKELADNVIGNINQNKVSVEDEVMTASSGLGGIFERWNHKNHEENKQLAIQDMQEADKAYKESVAKAEKMRMETEQLLFMHYEEMESLEFERIQTIKQAFISIAAALSNTIPLCKEMYDRMMLYQETLRPDKDVRFIVEQYRTGRYCPKPIIYESYFHGTVSGQAYGIALDQLAQIHHTMVPFIISEGLAVIESG
ncbi:hypothetical protein BDF14DRAFT_1803445 [Spinellus fusiger]|nr:hypothetical protein BDF14DRAFT_1803445 [Spinellus fusiger]